MDGNLLLTDSNNFEVIDDWPLHKTHRVHSTKLVVGACWQGAETTFKDFFRGYLAGLSVLKGKTESERVIKCLHNCKENLDFHALGDMSAGTVSCFSMPKQHAYVCVPSDIYIDVDLLPQALLLQKIFNNLYTLYSH